MLRAMKNDTILSGMIGKTEDRKIERRAKARGSYRPIGEHETFGARRGDTQELVPVFLGSAVVLMPRAGSDRSLDWPQSIPSID
ncbi:MAG: hypothetical protein JXJ17_06145 [Anaerolineae bacterium]|nr:hypothetical protein [Anaerolineae bacterium]